MLTVEETPVIINPDKFVRSSSVRRRRPRKDMGWGRRAIEGRSRKHPIDPFNGHARYEAADRRIEYPICVECLHGTHSDCESEACPCVCNDSDFRWARNKLAAIGAIPPADMEKALRTLTASVGS